MHPHNEPDSPPLFLAEARRALDVLALSVSPDPLTRLHFQAKERGPQWHLSALPDLPDRPHAAERAPRQPLSIASAVRNTSPKGRRHHASAAHLLVRSLVAQTTHPHSALLLRISELDRVLSGYQHFLS